MELKGFLVLRNKIHTHHQYKLVKKDVYRWEFLKGYNSEKTKSGETYYLIVRQNVSDMTSFEFLEKDLNKSVIANKDGVLIHPMLKNKREIWWW